MYDEIKEILNDQQFELFELCTKQIIDIRCKMRSEQVTLMMNKVWENIYTAANNYNKANVIIDLQVQSLEACDILVNSSDSIFDEELICRLKISLTAYFGNLL